MLNLQVPRDLRTPFLGRVPILGAQGARSKLTQTPRESDPGVTSGLCERPSRCRPCPPRLLLLRATGVAGVVAGAAGGGGGGAAAGGASPSVEKLKNITQPAKRAVTRELLRGGYSGVLAKGETQKGRKSGVCPGIL